MSRLQQLPARPKIHGPALEADLSERQAMVLRALVAAYVGQAAPVSSGTSGRTCDDCRTRSAWKSVPPRNATASR